MEQRHSRRHVAGARKADSKLKRVLSAQALDRKAQRPAVLDHARRLDDLLGMLVVFQTHEIAVPRSMPSA